MNTVYRLWWKNVDFGGGSDPGWSIEFPDTFLDRKSAQKYCDKANRGGRYADYEVAKDNGDNGPSFFDMNDPEPVSAIPPSSEDCWPPFSNPQPNTYPDDEPCPDTQRSSTPAPSMSFDLDIGMPEQPSPDAKRFVTMADLHATVDSRWYKTEIMKAVVANHACQIAGHDGLVTREYVEGVTTSLEEALKALV